MKVRRQELVFAGDPSRPLKLKGTNFQVPYHPRKIFREWSRPEIQDAMGRCRELGMNCLRLWLEPEAPDMTAHLADFVAMARDHGLGIYACLAWPSLYAREGSRGDTKNMAFLGDLATTLRDDPTVFAWDLANEPDWISHQHWQWNMEPDTGRQRIAWFVRMVKVLRKIDGARPISVGLIFPYSWWKPREAEELEATVDFVDFHYYPRNYRGTTLTREIRSLREHSRKPILLGEFGISSEEGFSTLGEAEHSDALQAEAYAMILNQAEHGDLVGLLQWTITDYQEHQEGGESFYGITRVDGTVKPAGEVFRDRYPDSFPKAW